MREKGIKKRDGTDVANDIAIFTIRHAIVLQGIFEKAIAITEAFSYEPRIPKENFVEEIKKSWNDYW
jgi:hypothetical protein